MRLALVLGVWLVACVASLYWFLGGQLSWFDPAGTLEHQASQPNFEQQLGQALRKRVQIASGNGTVVHIKSADCQCNWRAQSHITDLTGQAEQQGLQVRYLSLEASDELQRWLPATPAVILLNAQGELAYIGPYSAGAFCSSASSFVETLLPALTESSAPGGWVNTQSRGCYCSTSA